MQWLAQNEPDRAALLLGQDGAGSASTCPSFKPCLRSSRRSTTALGCHCHSSETDAVDNKKSGSCAAYAVFIKDSNA